MSIETKECGTPAGPVHYRVARGSAPVALLFIHGAGGNSQLFLNQIQYFGGAYTAIALDLPGHGKSPYAGVPGIDDYVRACEAVLETEKAAACVPAGHSMGGGVTFELFKKRPDLVRGMIFMATGAVLPVSPLAFDFMEKDYNTFCSFVVKLSFSKEAPDAVKSLAQKELEGADRNVVKNDFAVCNGFDYTGLLPSIAVPVLVLANRHDKMVPPDKPEGLAQGVKNARLVIYDKQGHLPFLENHGQVNGDIEAFMRDLAARKP